ncbi:MAG: S46 family peptidase [Bacteroidetes bacterium]|nr:S46 family peptidase [Bacteroidota bacterium]
MMKKIAILFVVLFTMQGMQVKADEGMWLPMFIDRLNYTDMQKLGLQLTAEEVYSVNNSSLKDAIVGLSNSPKPRGYFCTAEIVSSEGLLFTNHHCGYDAIQKHSSIEHDYLADGFWAMSREEELPNEELTASILVRMEDITDSIIPQLSDSMSYSERNDLAGRIIKRMTKANSEDGKYNVVIKSFFEGNEYYMFIYQVYKDVRLVGAPPSSIGKYGGDTDNWMWPRHTGDFSIFRIYTAPDGSPAEYSKENIPLKPKHYLPISLDGVEKGDFAMIWGFPGGTERAQTSYGVQFKMDYYYPPLIEAFGEKLDAWRLHMDENKEVKIKYASNYAQIANSWKYLIGQVQGVSDLDVIGEKQAFETRFTDWVNENDDRKERYGSLLADIQSIYKQREKGIQPLIYASLTGIGGAEIISYAQEFSGLQSLLQQYKEEKDKDKKAKKLEQINEAAAGLMASAPEHFKNYDKATDQEVFAVMTQMYQNKLAAEYQPEYLTKMVSRFDNDYYALSEYVFNESFLADQDKVMAYLEDPDLKQINKDPAFTLMQGFMQEMMEASAGYEKSGDEMETAERLYMEGVRKMESDKVFYPDANSTLRFSYGTVQDYDPKDAVSYDYVTHLSGLIDKEDPDNDEFNVPERLKELYELKDYGPYANEDGTLVVCFLTNNDITGGNSGSPVVNGKGELIGLAFDGNWEAMSSDIAFAPNMQRTIVVDTRYVLFIIDKFAGAGHLVDELTIHKTVPQPSRTEVVETVELDVADEVDEVTIEVVSEN